MDKSLKTSDMANMWSVAPITIRRWAKEDGLRPVSVKPNRYRWDDCIEMAKRHGVKVVSDKPLQEEKKEEKQENGKVRDMLDLDMHAMPMDSESLKDLKLRYEILAKIEDIRKKRQDSGRSLKEEDVATYLAGIREGIRTKAASVEDGLATSFDGLSPAQCAREVSKRMERYLREVSELKWNELVTG